MDGRHWRRRIAEAVGIELRNGVKEVEKGLHSRMQLGKQISPEGRLCQTRNINYVPVVLDL